MNAVVKFSQGMVVGAPGVALLGTTGSLVTIGNGDDSNGVNWKYELIDVPAASAVPTGTLSDGATPTASFTPDVRGCYLARVTTIDTLNKKRRSMPLAFGVLESSGRLVPPFGALASALNFGGNLRGYAKYIGEWLYRVDKTHEVALVNVNSTPASLSTVTNSLRHLLVRVRTATIAGPSLVTLPPSPLAGDIVVVKDVEGTASTNPVTVQGNGGATLDGAANKVINVDRGVLRLENDGTEWVVT